MLRTSSHECASHCSFGSSGKMLQSGSSDRLCAGGGLSLIAWLRVILVSLLVSAPGAGALLVQRVNGKLQFSEALSVQVNGKDKAMVLGERPDAAAVTKNPQCVRLNVSLIKDIGSGVVAAYSTPGPAKFLYPEGLNKKTPSLPPDAWKESSSQSGSRKRRRRRWTYPPKNLSRSRRRC